MYTPKSHDTQKYTTHSEKTYPMCAGVCPVPFLESKPQILPYSSPVYLFLHLLPPILEGRTGVGVFVGGPSKGRVRSCGLSGLDRRRRTPLFRLLNLVSKGFG